MSGPSPATATADLTAALHRMLNVGIATNVNGFPEFHDAVAWEKAAEVIGQYGRKGREIHVEGRISSRTREVEGHRIKQVDLMVENFQLLGPAPSGAAEA